MGPGAVHAATPERAASDELRVCPFSAARPGFRQGPARLSAALTGITAPVIVASAYRRKVAAIPLCCYILNCTRICRKMGVSSGVGHLDSFRQMLLNRKVVDVTFSNEGGFIATTLHLDDGSTFFVAQSSLTAEALREQFPGLFERNNEPKDFGDDSSSVSAH